METESLLTSSQGDATSLSWALTTDFLKTHLILSFYLQLVPPNSIFPSGFTTVTSVCTFPLLHATCPAHVFLIHMIARIMSVVAFISWSSPSCNFLQSIVTRSLLGPETFLRTNSRLTDTYRQESKSRNGEVQGLLADTSTCCIRHTHVYVCIYKRTYVCMCVCVCVCVWVCVCVCVCVGGWVGAWAGIAQSV